MSKSFLFYKTETDFGDIDFFSPILTFLALIITIMFSDLSKKDIDKTLAVKEFTILRFSIEYILQILWYKSCIVWYVFENKNFHNKGKYDWYGKVVISKREKDLHTKDHKSQNISCDLPGKRVSDKEEKDLHIRGCKSWNIDCNLPSEGVAKKREKDLCTIDYQRWDKDLDSKGIKNLGI